MKSCWDIEPTERPSFQDLLNQLNGIKSYYDESGDSDEAGDSGESGDSDSEFGESDKDSESGKSG